MKRIFVDYHSWIAKLIKRGFELISAKNAFLQNHHYDDIPQFSHPDFLDNGITSTDLGNAFLNLKRFERENNIKSLPEIVENAGKINISKGFLHWDVAQNLNPLEISAHIEAFYYKQSKIIFYSGYDEFLIPLLNNLLMLTQPLISVQDHTSIQFGSSGLRFCSTGLEEKALKMSSQPQLSATVIVAHSGYRKLPMGIVFPSSSTNDLCNQEILRSLINGDDPLPNDTYMWHTETGAATMKIMAEYQALVFPTMPDLPLYHSYDTAKANCGFLPALIMDQFGVSDKLVPSHLTCEMAEPDEAFMNLFKNGTEHSDGVKIAVAEFYNGILEYGQVIVNNGLISPMDFKTLFYICIAMYNAVTGVVLKFYRML